MDLDDCEVVQFKDLVAPGTRVAKCKSAPGDAHQDGALAYVVNVIGPAEVPGRGWLVGYQVVWDSHPGLPCFIAGHRVCVAHGAAAA